MRLTKKIKQRIDFMQSFLLAEQGNCIDVSDNEICFVSTIDKIWINACGVWCQGFSVSTGRRTTDYLSPEEFNKLFSYAKRKDTDFRYFLTASRKLFNTYNLITRGKK